MEQAEIEARIAQIARLMTGKDREVSPYEAASILASVFGSLILSAYISAPPEQWSEFQGYIVGRLEFLRQLIASANPEVLAEAMSEGGQVKIMKLQDNRAKRANAKP